ncbi:peptidoglycan/LPS O-acetylase OafA/YrhL [Bradyrhizobium japonicum]|uniref:acyltransferase family protein n=1 Tax=Bradyrhizobium japonicum TaxID=375 RepID=UPI002226E9B9|nr:acyltransferase [Bradyrhizobium japonicum]MCW2225435.1 peptidoglycan/LPS O-acetylase OafA/YrhL [Bradyrhizobium japonicum]MCW2340647.1 peptidoglycan/LPS O-acetylase OafA/YrhL [Bradyrhizobium japonicum]
MLAHQTKAHYVPLDSVRGLAALCVVVHHFVGSDPLAAALPHRAWIDVAFFHNSWLFVDLFFVLSGIVISMSYVQSEFSEFDFRTFTLRRIARIYPLHIVMLFAFLAFRLMRLTLTELDLLHFSTNETADLQVNNVYSFVANVFLLHAMGVLDYLSWNGPSWSISAEFYTYLVFGAVVVLSQRLGYIKLVYAFSAVLAVTGAALIIFVLKNETLDFQTNAFTRCFLGFFVGVLTLRFVSGKGRSVSPFVQSACQIGAAVVAIVLVSIVGFDERLSFVAPIVFGALLGSLMAFPERLLPKLLSVRPLVWLGKRSYSIYMTHALILVLIQYFARGVGTGRLQIVDNILPGLAASLLLAVFVVAVLVLSNLTYLWVEMPGSRFVLRLFNRRAVPAVAAAE